jgi:hypothetical protein
MSPGLLRFGTDFGNAAADRQFFQQDATRGEYLTEKRRILDARPARLRQLDDGRSRALLGAVANWMRRTLKEEDARGGVSLDPASNAAFRELSLAIQEDFAIVEQTDAGADRLILLSVCFPSGWQPERLLGKDFSFVHGPVPAFEAVQKKRRQLVSAMVERGPYVRFVWTVTPDAALDHHPVDAPRKPWSEVDGGVLRVERQVTVPFPQHKGALFLIRTYRYAFSELATSERATLRSALTFMPPDIARYKGLSTSLPLILERLA